MRLIADIGSCHGGRLDLCYQAVNEAKLCGYDLKFQLFKGRKYRKAGNIELSKKMFVKVFEYAQNKDVSCSASVFDRHHLDFLLDLKPPFVKLSYSLQDQEQWIHDIIKRGIECIVSTDEMHLQNYHAMCTTLWCDPSYPVKYMIDFEGRFEKFDGFSDHTVGTNQPVRAAEAGAKIIEKHMRISHEFFACPDARFALLPKQMGELCERLKNVCV